MNKFKKGDRVIVINELKGAYPSIYKVTKVYMYTDNTYLYSLIDTKGKGLFKHELTYLFNEEWLDLISK